MNSAILYTKSYCPHCVQAKNLLKRKGVTITEIDITHDEALQKEMIEKSGGRKTVPQIFIGDTHVGGNDDLQALNASGRLDALLAG